MKSTEPRVVEAERRVVALVGLALEARIATRSNALVVCHEKDCGLVRPHGGRGISNALGAAFDAGCTKLISFGLAGGLAPDLKSGTLIVASAILDEQDVRPTSASWSSRLCRALPGARYLPILGADAPVVDRAMRRELYRKIGAAAIDTESHLIARAALAHGMPFVALRVVIDPARRHVPAAALIAVRSDGTINVAALLQAVVTRPWDGPALLRLALDLMVARAKLVRIPHLLDM